LEDDDGASLILSAGNQSVVDCVHFVGLLMEAATRTRRTRFGPFAVELRAGELYKHGIRWSYKILPGETGAGLCGGRNHAEG